MNTLEHTMAMEDEIKTSPPDTSPKAAEPVPLAESAVNILLVDDEARNLDVLESILESPDRKLVRAQTAGETLLALIQNDFAVIVLDIQMPGMSGFELARLIKQRKRNRHIPIIFLTAYFHEDKEVLSGYDIGAVDFLTKPVNPQILKSKINVFAELFRTTRALAATNNILEQEIAQRENAEAALRHMNEELEDRVRQRMAETLRVNRELRESEERYRLILENALEYAIFTVDQKGLVTTWNSGAQRVLGFEEAEILGKPLGLIFTADDRGHGQVDLEMGRALANGRAQDERWHLRKDGSPFWASGLLMPLRNEAGEHLGFLKILRDRTQHKRAEEQQRETEILRASEREQNRIAQDLHDGLGQRLAGISCLSDSLKKDLQEVASPRAAAAEKISRLLNSAVAQTRTLARGLHPVAPEANGLMSGLEDLAVHITDLFEVSCRFERAKSVLIEDNATATHLYRIAQEAISNAIKHGKARHIQIGLSSTPEEIVLAVSDDGAGFGNGEGRPKGLGLQIMNCRAGVIGGTLVVEQKNSGGVHLTCRVGKTVKTEK